jgi:D-sedoheptulose 7-phosphate isomerase
MADYIRISSQKIKAYLRHLGKSLSHLPVGDLAKVVLVLDGARTINASVYTFGNGGSGATASHFASDLNKGAINKNKPRFRAVCLNDNVPALTAWANDVDYGTVFAEQVENFVRKGDVVIAISGSGNSPNVIGGVELAREKGAYTIGFTGFDGGLLRDKVDIAIVVQSDIMEQVEDIHLVLEHIITTCLREMG